MSDQHRELAGLDPERRELFELLLRKERLQGTALTDDRRDLGPKVAPLSFPQQGFWLFDQIEPNSCVYNVPLAARLLGPLKPKLLEESLARVIGRHEILRTACTMRDGQPAQIIMSEAEVPLPVIDLGQLDETVRESAALERARQMALEAFDLCRAPLLRGALFRLKAQDHLFVLVTHHFVTDGWSVELLLQELASCYRSLARGDEPSLPVLGLQYADYAVWQQNQRGSAQWESEVAYWMKELDGAPEILALPTDRPRPRTQSYHGGTISFTIPVPLSQALRALSRREGVTLFMTLVASFHALLHRHTGQDDIIVSTAVSNRNRVETEGLIGSFANSVLLRSDTSDNPTFRMLLNRVREAAVRAYAHQDLPFEKLVEKLRPERDLSRNPLSQVMFLLHQKSLDASFDLPGLSSSVVPIDIGMTKFDLSVTMRDGNQELSARVQYSLDLFDTDTMDRLVGHFQTLLEGVVTDPGRRLSDLPLLTNAERHRLLVEWDDTKRDYPKDERIHELFSLLSREEAEQIITGWNQTATPYPANRCVHQEFERHAELQPEAPAVVGGGEPLSYGELNYRSGRLAEYLRSQGVGVGSRVALCMDRSLEMIIGMLAILKAGGVYVPLDPAYPAERLAFLVNEVAARVILTNAEAGSSLAATSAKVICLERDWPLIEGHGGQIPCPNEAASAAASGDLAYVIFTSGSTGTPKGVAVPHCAIMRLVLNTNYVELGPSDRIAHLSNVCFDATTFEIWGALLTGGCVVLVSKAVALDADRFGAELERQKVSTLFVTTALFNELSAANSRIFQSVKQVLFGGEAVNAESVRRVLESGGAPGRLLHVYGPTECTTFATFYPVSQVEKDAGSIPIGRPIANTTAYVLDRHGHPVPIGVPGELYLGGPGVAQGYLNQPELTREHFVADPFAADHTRRLYRTGDIVKYLPDGNIEFIGRSDGQIKIRGFRIEPGEIEAVLKRHSEVEDAVVIAREDTPGDRRLVAYLVPRPGAAGADWRGTLHHKLPAYMVPSVFVELEALPLTPNGKVDRRTLPAPERQIEAYRAPRTPQEEILCGIFADLLSVNRVGIDDNFFELGGHSLLAMQLVSRVRGILGLELAVRAVFEAPNVAGLATRLQEARSNRPPLMRLERPERLPLSYAQQGLWFLYCLEGSMSGYHMREALHFKGALDIAALESALNGLVKRHESLRARFDEVDGESFQIVEPHLQISLQVDDLSNLDERAREKALRAALHRETEEPFDLRAGPLLRTRLLKVEEEDHIFLWVCHHIVSDGWSVGVFKRELSLLYESFRQHTAAGLEPLAVQFPDYALWQRGWLTGERLDCLLSYWRGALDQAPVLDLPTDAPRPVRQSYSGARHMFRLPSGLCRRLAEFNRREHVTPFISLLAAYQVLLSRYSAQEDFLIGTPIANRGSLEAEQMIGLFVNTLVVRADLSGTPDFREVVARARAKALDVFQHQDLPFDRLVQELCPQRDLGRHPLFQATFALQNAPEHPLVLPGLEVSLHSLPSSSTRFDLELHLRWEGEACVGVFSYSTDLFETATIERMAGHFATLLEDLVKHPEVSVGQLSLLTGEQAEQIITGWNQTATPYPANRCVHQEFERHAELQPEAPAVVGGGEPLSYGELNYRSGRLAEYLRSQGVGVGSRVALCMDRSLEMIIGMLAILKAGGVYVPLDPAYPAERLAFLVNEVAARVILTNAEAGSSLAATSAKVICLERDWPLIEGHGGQIPCPNEAASAAASGDLAYVIFTSGSTGTPKGVAVPHCAIMRLVLNTNYVELGPSDRIAHLSNVCFDAATFEIWGALLTGGCVVLVSKAVALDADRFGAELERQKVSTLFVTTALFNELSAANSRIFQSVKQVLFGGEAVNAESVRRVLESGGAPGRLLHVYGPTECTTFATFYPVSQVEKDAGSIPIGRPIANTTAYVLDRHGHPVPIGVPGELYLGGPGVAQGYLNQPELTREHFVADPFAADHTRRLYRTGDIVKYLPDGNIEFIGRSDGQIKIRGFRIEPGEIEAVLKRHSEVEDAVVIAREDDPGRPPAGGLCRAQE